MNVLGSIVVFILTIYLSVTNSLATFVEDLLTDGSAEVEMASDSEFALLPSIFDTTIPDILLRNAAYQQAALGSAGRTGRTVEEPVEALVNIFCTFTTEEYVKTTTGSGFFIDPDGIIITNAHVAQFLLLEETNKFGDAECIIRAGSPAAPEYKAELLYIPPAWIQENATNLSQAVPLGTGERDYALLFVQSSVDNDPLPTEFPALSVDDNLLPVSIKNSDVVLAGYPATDLIRNGRETALIAKQADAEITELYTFGSNYADVFSISGTEVGAEGASGGPVLDEAGNVIGLITTRGDDDNDGAGSLRAITMSHISRTMAEETGLAFEENLNGNLPLRAKLFTETVAPFLIQMLEQSN